MRISVIGTGYLGATHAACLAACGHEVVGIDTDAERTRVLASGAVPFHEPDLDLLVADGLRMGLLSFTTELEAAHEADVHFLCVGTPQRADGEAADLSALTAAVTALAPLLERDVLVVGKSTVPVGTAEVLGERLRAFAPAGDGVRLAWNPEFLREGHAVQDSLRPDRLVLGVEDDESDLLLREVYRDAVLAGVPVVRTDLATAELAKVSANAMLAARISLVNMLAEVCEVARADIADLTGILGLDPRIGPDFLRPGIGYGGGCLPKDTRAFVARAEELGRGEAVRILREVDRVNRRQRARVVDLAETLVGGSLDGLRVAALGAAFKAGSDDVRDSPALAVVRAALDRGAEVRVHDPQAATGAAREVPAARVAEDVDDACRDADVVLLLTDWDDYRGIDPVALASVVGRPVVVDGRLALDREKWEAAGWDFHALGRGA